MNIQDLRKEYVGNTSQICVFDADGTLLESCNTITSLQKGISITEVFPFLEEAQAQILSLEESDSPIDFPGSLTQFGKHEAFLILKFLKKEHQGQSVIICLVKNELELFNSLNQTNQTKTEALLEKLASLNQELDRFAYVVSHDLKAPLRGIRNLVTFINEDLGNDLPEDVNDNMAMLNRQVDKMAALIDAILLYSRAGRNESEAMTVNCSKLLAELLPTLDLPGGFHVHLGENLPVIKSHSLYLKQIFSNLITNAYRHHGSSSGNIWISGSMNDKGEIGFSVKDDGEGIDLAHHERIFEIFQSLNTRDPLESTGIGLPIVKKLVKELGGSIRVESAKGEGANFIFSWTLPQDQA